MFLLVGSKCKTALTCLVMSTSTNLPGLNLASVASASRRNPLRMAPNLLTLLRIFLAPFLIVAALERRFELAFALFLLAAFTDALDGLLARWLSQRTIDRKSVV